MFSDALRFSAYEWGEGRPAVPAQVLAFMHDLLAGGDEKARGCVVAGFLDPIASPPSSPALEAFLATWPEPLRREFEERRGEKGQVTDGVWVETADDTDLIEVLWLTTDAQEAVASDGLVVYVVGDGIQAIDVATKFAR